MKTTPAAQRWPSPDRSSWRFGLTTADGVRQRRRRPGGGRARRHRRPRARAAARASALFVPQSTVTISARRAAASSPHRRRVRAVALEDPVGNVDLGLDAEDAQKARQQRRGRGAVDVVVAEDRHLLAAHRSHRRSRRPPRPCRSASADRASGRGWSDRGSSSRRRTPPRRARQARGRRCRGCRGAGRWRARPAPAAGDTGRSSAGREPSARLPGMLTLVPCRSCELDGRARRR